MSIRTVFIPERGVIADFNLNPALGSETRKIRPCLVVSNNIYHQKLSVIQVVPITEWSEKKAKVVTNIVIEITPENGLIKKSIADYLQTRPIDYTKRYIRSRGKLDRQLIDKISSALKIVFAL